MGTRQNRLMTPEQMRTESASYLGRQINVVLKNNSVVFGSLSATTDKYLVLKNMRGRKTSVPVESISEIYLDSNL